jgi:hypothetical protein
VLSRESFEAKFGYLAIVFKELCYTPYSMSIENGQPRPELTRRQFLKDTFIGNSKQVVGNTARIVGLVDGFLYSIPKQRELEKQGKKDHGLGFRLLGDLTLLLLGNYLHEKGMEEQGMGYKQLRKLLKDISNSSEK